MNHNDKPSILSIVVEHVRLRKSGKEYVGLCPFHSERTPSFYVNEEKGLFHCFGRGGSGDAIRFVELIGRVSFRDAVSILGIGNETESKPTITSTQRKAAALAAGWMAEQRRKIGVLLGDILEQIQLADEIYDGELAESLLREQSFLRDLYDDLDVARYAGNFLSLKDSIEQITEGVCS